MMDRAASAADVPDTAAPLGLAVERRHAAGVITLARPEARNALSTAMAKALAEAYPALARDPIIYAAVVSSVLPRTFCPGADFEEIALLAGQDLAQARQALAEHIGLFWLHECFSKPTVSVIDGAVAGAGAGISLHGTHRVAGEAFTFSCPETALGLVPSGGVGHALSRLPGALGMYLALTGREIGRADAWHLGLATHCIDAPAYEAIQAALADADPVDALLDPSHADPGSGALPALKEPVARCFSAGSIAGILTKLEAERGAHEGWARETLAALARRSSLALAATHAFLHRAADLDVRETLMLEHRLLCNMIGEPEFLAAAAAMAADATVDVKPQAPAADCERRVAALMAPAPEPLLLPTRAEMQAKRV